MNKKETVLITGATSGIGKSLAYKFSKNYNYDLVLVSRNISKLEFILKDLSKNNKNKIFIFEVDLTKNDSSKKIINFLEKNEIDISILVNNAGIGQENLLDQTSIKHSNDIISVNVSSLVNLTRELVPKFKERGGGKILNVSSVVGFYPMPKSSIYSASKSFVNFFSESLRLELKKFNIKVSILCPGTTITNIKDNFEKYYENKNELKSAKSIKTSLAGIKSSDQVAEIAIKDFLKNKFIIIPGYRNKIFTFIMSTIGYKFRDYLIYLKIKK